jgi:hypothetical protein
MDTNFQPDGLEGFDPTLSHYLAQGASVFGFNPAHSLD